VPRLREDLLGVVHLEAEGTAVDPHENRGRATALRTRGTVEQGFEMDHRHDAFARGW
jgi:hypothetical protein